MNLFPRRNKQIPLQMPLYIPPQGPPQGPPPAYIQIPEDVKNLNVIICGTVKNVGNLLKPNLDLAIKTGELFNKYKIVIYENNSTDNTKNILQQYTTNTHFTIISEDIDILSKEKSVLWSYMEITGNNHPCKIEHLSNARNRLIEEINKIQDYSYVIMIDFDSNGWQLEGIIDSLSKRENWDAIFANSPEYYDYYALRTTVLPFGPEFIGETFWRNINQLKINSPELISVYSAFNGIGIYKKELFETYKYDFMVNDVIKEFYKNFINSKQMTPMAMNIISNPCPIFPFGYKDENIFWKSNSGYNGAVVCEHTALHFALVNDNYKLYINPKMIYYPSDH